MADVNVGARKSDQDPKLYRYLTLPNRLRVLLVRDPRQEARQRKAAAALSVGAGSFADPRQVQGLSHFLEHMISMGCEEFPGENAYASYLDAHGGSENAWTDLEVTCFH